MVCRIIRRCHRGLSHLAGTPSPHSPEHRLPSRETFLIGSGISVQPHLGPGTHLSPYTTTAVNRTGGDPCSIVRVTINRYKRGREPEGRGGVCGPNGRGRDRSTFEHGSSGGPKVCCYGVEPSTNPGGHGEIIVDVLPAGGIADSITVPRLSQSVDFIWAYHYVFARLTITH